MIKKIVIPIILTSLMSSCQFIDNAPTSLAKRENAYLNAESQPPLRVPPGVNGNKFHSDYPVSPPTQPLGQLNPVPQKID